MDNSVGALIPLASSHNLYMESEHYHPAIMFHKYSPGNAKINDQTDYVAFGMLKWLSYYTANIIATIPPPGTINSSIRSLLSKFINVDSLFAEVTFIDMEKKHDSVINQLIAAFSQAQYLNSIIVVMPYQLAKHVEKPTLTPPQFTYYNKQCNFNKEYIPECTLISISDQIAKSVVARDKADDMTRGIYSNVLSSFIVTRQQMDVFLIANPSGTISDLANSVIPGRIGYELPSTKFTFPSFY